MGRAHAREQIERSARPAHMGSQGAGRASGFASRLGQQGQIGFSQMCEFTLQGFRRIDQYRIEPALQYGFNSALPAVVDIEHLAKTPRAADAESSQPLIDHTGVVGQRSVLQRFE